MAVEIEDQTDVISVHTKKITGNTFTGQHKASSVVDFYDNYEVSSIAGRVEPLPNGGKPVPDSLKKAQEYLIFGELKKGQQAGKSNLLANHALFFDIEPPNPKEGEAWEPLEYSDVNDVVSRELDGLQYVLHNTINSQERYARFRLVIPTDQAMDEKEYHSTWDYVAEQLNALPLDSSSREWYRLQGAPIYNGLGTDVFEVNDVGELLSIEDINKYLEAMKADELSKNTTPQNVTAISADDFEKAMELVVKHDEENLMKEEHYFKWFPILANGVKNGEIDENMAYLATSYISLGNADWERENRNRLRNELQKIGRGNLPPAEWTVRSKINAVPNMKKDPDNPVKPKTREKSKKARTGDTPLILDKYDNVMKILTNLQIMISVLSESQHIKFNEFTQEVEYQNKPIDDLFIDEARMRVDNVFYMKWSKDDVLSVINLIAQEKRYHPIKQIIEAKPWDGVERVESLFIDYLGASDNEYIREVTKRWLTGAIARIYNPGCKFEIVPILQGKQGIGKSTISSKLGGNYFLDTLKGMGKSKDDYQLLLGAWFVELAELSSMNKTDIETLKGFISGMEDKVRLPYDRLVSTYKRTCVFIGTTNSTEYLEDPTGNRRFFPIPLRDEPSKDVFTELNDEIRQQVFAEALTYYRAKYPIYFGHEDIVINLIAEEYRQEAIEKSLTTDNIQMFLDMPVNEDWNTYSIVDKRKCFESYINGGAIIGDEILTKTTKNEIAHVAFELKAKDQNADKISKVITSYMENHDDWEKKPIKYQGKTTRGYSRKM